MMARIRSIKIGFFQNEILSELTSDHRLLFIGLWLLADREGRLEDRPKRIKAELFPYQGVDVARLCHDLFTAGFVLKYKSNGRNYLQVVNFTKHQKPHPREALSVIPAPEPGNYTARHDLGVVEPGGSGDLGLGDLGSGGGDKIAPAPLNVHVDTVNGQVHKRAETAEPQTSIIRQSRGSLAGKHHLCPEGTWAACERGLCLPGFLYTEWLSQCGGDPATIAPFVDLELSMLPLGPVGDPVKFWRGKWDARFRTPEPSQTGSTASTMAAARQVMKERGIR